MFVYELEFLLVYKKFAILTWNGSNLHITIHHKLVFLQINLYYEVETDSDPRFADIVKAVANGDALSSCADPCPKVPSNVLAV